MPVIKAIETSYGGCQFRSRLEARWAVFFDQMGIKWRYEPEGFKLIHNGQNHYYLPDFFLPQVGTWLEIKGHEQSLDEHNLLPLAAAQLPQLSPELGFRQGPIIMLLGPIPEQPGPGFDWGWVSAVRAPDGENCPPVGDRFGTLCCGWSLFHRKNDDGDYYGPFRQEFCGNSRSLEPCVIPGGARVDVRAAYKPRVQRGSSTAKPPSATTEYKPVETIKGKT